MLFRNQSQTCTMLQESPTARKFPSADHFNEQIWSASSMVTSLTMSPLEASHRYTHEPRPTAILLSRDQSISSKSENFWNITQEYLNLSFINFFICLLLFWNKNEILIIMKRILELVVLVNGNFALKMRLISAIIQLLVLLLQLLVLIFTTWRRGALKLLM